MVMKKQQNRLVMYDIYNGELETWYMQKYVCICYT